MRPIKQVGLLATAAALAALACAPVAAGPGVRVPQIRYKYYRLANGLRVILSEDHTAPVVAVSVTYDVGSRNERPGRSGFAHLFEHMMFQGSQNVGRGEHMMLVAEVGGTLNGSTSQDRTNYYEAVPANQLDLALFLESDRMRSLDISQANLDNQRLVVKEERRQSYDNQPYGQMREVLQAMAYTKFGYSHSTIGSMADLNSATLDDVRQFFGTYYAPNNAALAVVGDFKEGEVRKKIEQAFGSIPSGPKPPDIDIAEPPSTAEQRKEMTDPLARATSLQIAYRTVAGDHADAAALQMLGGILSRPRTGRLYSAIVEKRLAGNASAGGFAGRGPGLFNFSAMIQSGDPAKVEAAWEAELAKVQADGVTEAEVANAKRSARVAALSGGGGGRGGGGAGMGTALGRANALSQNAIYYDNPGRMNTMLERTEAVTAADIKRVANQYLTKQNRVVVTCYPEETPDMGFYLPADREAGR